MKEPDKLLIIRRDKYTDDTTFGKLFIEKDYFCETLEDTVRPYGVKVKRHTAIPESFRQEYKLGVRYSPSAKRERLIIYTEDDKETISLNGVTFRYCYLHGGNTHENTEGCPLVAKNRMVNREMVQDSMEEELFNLVAPWIKEGLDVRLLIVNLPQNN
jgi:hypothetical protein